MAQNKTLELSIKIADGVLDRFVADAPAMIAVAPVPDARR